MPRGTVVVVSCLATLVAGVLMALQSRINGQLAVELGQPVEASWWSFGSGLVLVLVIVALMPSAHRAWSQTMCALRERRIRWWMLLAGVFGGALVWIQAMSVPLVGVAVFTVSVVAGQTAGGLLVDALGMGPGGKKPLSVVRVLAAVGGLIGVGVAVTATGAGHVQVVPILLAVGAGLGTSVQTAWNSRITAPHGQPMVASLFNFVTGTAMLLVLMLVLLAQGTMRLVPLRGPWWVWFGGVTGVIFVATAAVVVKHIGVLMFTLVSLVSQLATALVLDVFTPGIHDALHPQRLLGLAITAVAAAAAGVAATRASRRAR